MSNSLWLHGLQHARLPCPSPTPAACSNSCPSSRSCHPISSSVVPFSSCFQPLPAFRVFSKESVLRFRWPKYWSFSFSISHSNEYSGLISFRIDLFDLLAVQGTLKSFLQHRSVGEVFYWRWKVTPKQTISLGSCWPHSQLSKSLFIYFSNKGEVGGRR